MNDSDRSTEHQLGTRALHTAPKPEQGQPFNVGPAFASAFHLAGDPGSAPYQYTRYGNPTWVALEATIGALEGGRTVIFPSGMAAVAATFLALCRPGDTLLLPSDCYFGSRTFATTYLERWGVELRFVATPAFADADFTGVRLVHIETPSNPGLDVCDIQLVADRAHAAGALVVVDNTTASPLGQQPLALGADLLLSSDSKILNGHTDVVFGHVTSADAELIEEIAQWRKISGTIPGPMEAWLVQRGLQTLEVRHQRQTDNAQRIAEYLNEHAAVASVRYPGLPDDPAHRIARQQMQAFGSIITFELAAQAAAEAFLANGGVICEATSFGGVHTMAERRARWGGDDLPAGAIRLSVGCEPIEDLLAQIEASLVAAQSAS